MFHVLVLSHLEISPSHPHNWQHRSHSSHTSRLVPLLLEQAKLLVGEILEVNLFALIFTVRDKRTYNDIDDYLTDERIQQQLPWNGELRQEAVDIFWMAQFSILYFVTLLFTDLIWLILVTSKWCHLVKNKDRIISNTVSRRMPFPMW